MHRYKQREHRLQDSVTLWSTWDLSLYLPNCSHMTLLSKTEFIELTKSDNLLHRNPHNLNGLAAFPSSRSGIPCEIQASLWTTLFITSRNQVRIAPQRHLEKVLGAISYSLKLYAQTSSHRNIIKRFSFPSGRIALIAMPETPFQTSKEAPKDTSAIFLVTSPLEASQQGQAPKGSFERKCKGVNKPSLQPDSYFYWFQKVPQVTYNKWFLETPSKRFTDGFQTYLYVQCSAGLGQMFYFCFTRLQESLICKCAST